MTTACLSTLEWDKITTGDVGMPKQLLLVAMAVALLSGIGYLALDSSKRAPSSDALEKLADQIADGELSGSDIGSVASAVNSLAQVLDAEIAERRILAEQLEELRGQLTDLQTSLGIRVLEANSAAASISVDAEPQPQPEDFATQLTNRLAAAGFTEKEAEALRRRQGAMQMQQVELDDRARREGWVNTPRYYQEMSKVSNDTDPIRAELGDDAFDRYLFAVGRPNRLRVGRVIETSPAEQAGLRQGDVILSYAGQRVFSTQQLTSLRSGGERGAAVTVEILRDGVPMQLTFPRGPMGVQTQPEIVDPVASSGR